MTALQNMPFNNATACAPVETATVAFAFAEDPVLIAIRAFRDGMEVFNATRVTDDERYALAEATYARPLEVLQGWTAPATTLSGAVHALRVALDEACDFASEQTIPAMLGAAMSFLDQADPLADAIKDADDGLTVVRSFPDDLPREEDDRLMEEHYVNPMSALSEWTEPARSIETVAAALRLMKRDRMFDGDSVATALVNACIGYFDGAR